MRTVLHVLVPEPPGEVGGADLHVLDLAVEQQRRGVRVMVFERGSAEYAQRVRDAGVGCVSATGSGLLAGVRLLSRCVRELRPDVVHAHGYDADYLAAAAQLTGGAGSGGVPLVFTQHGIVDDTLWHRAKTALDAVCTRRADGVIICGTTVRARVQRWLGPGCLEFIPNGVSMPQIVDRGLARAGLARRFGVPTEGTIVSYVGRLSPEKRPDLAVTAVHAAREAGHPAHLLIVGSGSLRERLAEQVARLGMADSVTFTGCVHDVSSIYSALDALLLLSDTECTPRVVIEAMMSGVPVVATAVGGVPYLLDAPDAGVLVPPGDPAAAAAALRSVLARPPGSATRSRARERFGVATMADRVAGFYERTAAWVAAGRRVSDRTGVLDGA